MPRFFVSPSAVSHGTVTVCGKDAFHIARSLRMAVGDMIEISDGEGTEYTCRLTRIRDDECVMEITDTYKSSCESPVRITLFMALPKGDKLETVVQKSVELGAAAIVPFESERCIKKAAPDKQERHTERLLRIAHEAAKQCGRGILPRVESCISFASMLSRLGEFDLVLFCYEGDGTTPLRRVLESCEGVGTVAVIVGSEGGFSPAEAEKIRTKGAECVGLGPRILRCETAPDYVLSALSYRFELD